MRAFIFFIAVCSISLNAQTFSIAKITSNTNGNPGPMKGIPGDLFASTVSFSNSSSSVIYVVVDRYKNDIPPYWAVCYCYIQCHSPREDSIMVEIQPFSTTDITLQFKTDSVNPGIAKEGFNVYQVGFESNIQDIQMTASTLNDVGIVERHYSNQISIYPNPSTSYVSIEVSENISDVKVFDISGNLKEVHDQIQSRNFTLNTQEYADGVYFIQAETEENMYVKRFIKN